MNINLHHVELFYHVCRHSGLSEAARKMPYGIQPSTISRQLCELERETGLILYERRPFKLTAAGEKLFVFIQPMFDQLPGLIQRLRKGVPDLVRLGASAIVLREYLPSILRPVKRNFPGLRVAINEGMQWQIDGWLKEKAIDLAVTLLEGELPPDYLSEPLLRLPLVLLVDDRFGPRDAAELWNRERIKEMLIGPPPEDAISRSFRRGLQRHGIEWVIEIEANSIGLVETYVEQGFGVGVSVALPSRKVRKGLRAVSLPDFPLVPVGMIWQRDPNPATQALLREFRRAAQQVQS